MSTEPSPSLAEVGADLETRFVMNMVQLREKRGLTQGGLAALLREKGLSGMYQTTLSRIEQHSRALKFHEALAIARALGSTMEQMLMPSETYLAVHEVLQRNMELADVLHRMVRDMKTAASLTEGAVKAVQVLEDLDWEEHLPDIEVKRAKHAMRSLRLKSEHGLTSFLAAVEKAYGLSAREMSDESDDASAS